MPDAAVQSGKAPRALTLRAVAIGCVAMVWMAMWIHFHEVLVPQPTQLAENSPPVAAVGLFLGVLITAGLLRLVHRGLQLHRGETLIIYCMLLIAAPIMSQGMWHRFLGLVVAIPHNKHNMDLADSYSLELWPHGQALVRGIPSSTDSAWTASHPQRFTAVDIAASQVGPVTGVRLDASDAPTDEPTTLSLRIAASAADSASFQPGERYYCTSLIRIASLAPGARVTMTLRTQAGATRDIFTLTRESEPAFAHPGGFLRRGEPYVSLPRDVTDTVYLDWTIHGSGAIELADVQLFSNEALARLHKGVSEVRATDLERIPPDQRDALLVRPDSLASVDGIAYTLRGYIPWRQWLKPLTYWLVIVLAMFACTLGMAVIFRKQWAQHERFAFPMIVVPRMLIESRAEFGDSTRALLRHPAFLAGVGVALLYALLLGLAHYVPGFPSPKIDIPLAERFHSPAIKAAINGFGGTNRFTIVLLFVAIAFFVDLQLLASVLIFFVLVHIPHYLGESRGWKVMAGPNDRFPFPHSQHIGAFLCLALLVLWVSRRHLADVGRHILGRARGSDDGEAMRYRTAALLIIASFVVFAVWGAMTGLGSGNALLFFGFLIVCALAAARIRTEFGAPFTYITPYFPFLIFYLLGGLTMFGTKTLLLAYFAGGFMAVAQFLMFAPSQVEMLELARLQRVRPRSVAWAMTLGIVGGVVLGGYVMLVWANGVGSESIEYMRNWAVNQDWYFNTLRQSLADANRASINPDQATASSSAAPLTAVGVGAGVTLLVSVARMHFVGFWLHPIGYVLANTFFIYAVWGSILVALLIKGLALRLGGPRLLRRVLTPFFVGIFTGSVAAVMLTDVLAAVLWFNGHSEVHVFFP